MKHIAVHQEIDCVTVTLNRPEVANALSAEMVEELTAAVAEAEAARAHVLVFRGQGRHFCAGFDFGGFEAQSEGELLQRFVRIELLLQAIARSSCITIAFAMDATSGRRGSFRSMPLANRRGDKHLPNAGSCIRRRARHASLCLHRR